MFGDIKGTRRFLENTLMNELKEEREHREDEKKTDTTEKESYINLHSSCGSKNRRLLYFTVCSVLLRFAR